jgi:cyclopropane-fatty-acyl-phospholipid synthase
VDEVTYRIYRLYLAGAAHSFDAGHNNIFQSLLARPNDDGSSTLPLTRRDLYAEAEAAVY